MFGKARGETHTGAPVLFIRAGLLFLQTQECRDLCLLVGTYIIYTDFQFLGVKRWVMSLREAPLGDRYVQTLVN